MLVKPTALTLLLVPPLSRLGLLLSLLSLTLFAGFMLGGMLELPGVPQVDKGLAGVKVYESVKWMRVSGEETADRLFFNSMLVTIFWFQHSLLARSSVKTFLNSITANQYYFYEKSFYAVTASLALLLVIFAAEPISDVMLVKENKEQTTVKIA
jgi:hypothetical protein